MSADKWMVVTAVASLRSEPSHKSERVSELLFGETCNGIGTSGDFIKIKSDFDGYEGWCQKRQLVSIPIEFNQLSAYQVKGIQDKVFVNGIPVLLSPGSIGYSLNGKNRVQIGPYIFDFQNDPNDIPALDSIKDKILFYARLFLGTPYLWGGRSRYGIDCSGLTQTVFKLAEISLPRDSGPQSREGEIVNLLQEARAGDLAFFDNEEGHIHHVGILLGDDSILHASASVRIDPIDSHGIIHKDERTRTHTLRIIKRFF